MKCIFQIVLQLGNTEQTEIIGNISKKIQVALFCCFTTRIRAKKHQLFKPIALCDR